MLSNPGSHPPALETIEVVRGDFPRGDFRAAIFDFDGTLSLLRQNWQDVMIPMMVDILAATGTSESREQLHAHVEDFVMRLNGRQTIYQMIRLAEEIALRGGRPLDPLEYKHRYHDLLWQQLGGADELEASFFGNLVASITVQQLGTTGTASPRQVRRGGTNSPSGDARVVGTRRSPLTPASSRPSLRNGAPCPSGWLTLPVMDGQLHSVYGRGQESGALSVLDSGHGAGPGQDHNLVDAAAHGWSLDEGLE